MRINKEIEQRTPEWLKRREGKFTGSTVNDVIGKRGQKLKGYYKLIAGRIAVKSVEDDLGETPQARGTRLEPEAIDCAIKILNLDPSLVFKGGMFEYNDYDVLSPDAFHDTIAPEFGIEAKCLETAAHIQAILDYERYGRIPEEYEDQVADYFECTSIKVVYFVLHDPRLVSGLSHLRTYIITIRREDFAEQIERVRKNKETAMGYLMDDVRMLKQINDKYGVSING